MPTSLSNRVALVTGGSSGIGKASALAFAREGAKVVVADLDVEGGEDTVCRIEQLGSEGVFVHTDVSSAADVEALVEQVVRIYGCLDCAFNNAGILRAGGIVECTEADWDLSIDINLKGVWMCMKYEILQMLKQDAGVIVNTASVYGLVATGVGTAYIASKHGIIGLTKTAALQYAKRGIRVNAVCPAYVHTPMIQAILGNPENEERIVADHPVGRLGTPEEVAEAVVWLCSDAASFITGHALPVDGGYVAR